MVVYFLSLDESYDGVARDRMLYFGQLLKESNVPRLEYDVDGSYPKETMERLEKVLDIANLGLEDCDSPIADEIKKRGIKLWFYENGASIIDGDGLKCRALSSVRLEGGRRLLGHLGNGFQFTARVAVPSDLQDSKRGGHVGLSRRDDGA